KETDLYYLNARYYDSKTARFLSEDTYTGDPNDPLSLNLYSYCVNNPITYSDPSGHWQESDKNLIQSARIAISQLTDIYVTTSDPELKKACAAQAAAIRNCSANIATTPQNSEVGMLYEQQLKKDGYVSASDWLKISNTYKKESTQNAINGLKMTESPYVPSNYKNQAIKATMNTVTAGVKKSTTQAKPQTKPQVSSSPSPKVTNNGSTVNGTGKSEVIIPEYLYDAEKDKWLSNSSQNKLADLTLQWYQASSQSARDSILKIIRLARIDINDSPVDEVLNLIADEVIDGIFGGSILGEIITRTTGSSSEALEEKRDVIEQAKLAYVICSVMNTNFKDIANTKSPSEFIKELEDSGWKKTIEPGGGKSGPATILTDTNTGIKVRVQESPTNGNPYFRVQNKGGNYLDSDGSFPSNAAKKEMRNLTHFEFKIKK
ncbi:RHS repeat-associated core domain-containing protein, partial [Ruminiclostridium papyrosolvens]|uniref:RHS repeat-associated core domain-containing protein n=1 Tax=Ruminiclostridium papyrosolvens TaxID=29362 RepID=UPI0004CFBC1B